jgi:hypothetical protein
MKQRRQNRFPEAYHKELRRKTPVPSEPWSLRDKLSVAGGLIFALMAFFFSDIGNIFQQRQLVSQRLERWRTEYGLEQKHIKALREIEYEFHGNGLPFSNPPRVTPVSRKLHDQEIAAAMGPTAGAQFLAQGSGH